MEFNEKLSLLRKSKGITQEELAGALFVSRTAISKWESGRGFPGIDSLKAISKFFDVSIDELLSGDEILAIAKEDQKKKVTNLRDLIFGLLDCSMVLFIFLPLFGQGQGGSVTDVSLLSLTAAQPYVKIAYLGIVFALVAVGILTLALQNLQSGAWTKSKTWLSLILSAAAVCLFVLTRQPYAAIFVFVFLLIKSIMLIKRP